MKEFYQYDYKELTVFQTPNLWQSYQSYNYILAKGNEAVIFDPGELGPLVNTIEKNGLKLTGIYITHHHNDHVGAVREMREKYSCPVFGFAKDQHRLPVVDHSFDRNEKLNILEQEAFVFHWPGHTLGLCAFYFPKEELLFSNDHIFSLGCGRVFEGSYEQMYNNLERVKELPKSTKIFPSHEYTATNLEFSRSILPDDNKLLELQNSIEKKLSSEIPTVPTQLDFELKNNLFLRTHEEDLKKALNLSGQSEAKVFAELRRRKDAF